MTDILAKGRALAESYNREGNGFDNIGKKNAYECEKCRAYIVTIDRAPGVTPFMTKCGNCGGMAKSKFYRVADWLEPSHEWYRPDSLDGIAAGYHEHLSRGGLILRPINGAGWITDDPVKHPLSENRKSQFIYVRPDLGTRVVPYHRLDELCRELGVEPGRENGYDSTPVPQIGTEAREYLERWHSWDLEVTS